jgi:hypothetical protein
MTNLLANVAKSPQFDEDSDPHKIRPDPDRDPGPHHS